MHQGPLLFTPVTCFTATRLTVDRESAQVRAGHSCRTGGVLAPAHPSSPGVVVLAPDAAALVRPAPRPRGPASLDAPPGADQNESMPLTSARQVAGPTIPSTVIPSACWKLRTAVAVLGPKIPSTARPRPGPPDWSRNRNSSWR